MKPGLTRTDNAPFPGAYLSPIERLNGGGGLVSTLHDMVALIRSLLPGGKTLLKPETIALMMTNQLPEGQWIRFAMMGEQTGQGARACRRADPKTIADRSSRCCRANSIGAAWPAPNHGGISPKRNMAGVMMAQRQMAFVHPFSFEFNSGLVYRR